MSKEEEAAEDYTIKKHGDHYMDESQRLASYVDYLAGIKWRDENPAWVDVREQLPNEYQEVLVQNEYLDFHHAYFANGDFYKSEGGRDLPTVTYWMPLPELVF